MGAFFKIEDAEAAVLAGLLAPSDQVNVDGIIAAAAVWASLREKFPVEEFHDAVARGSIEYEPDAGE